MFQQSPVPKFAMLNVYDMDYGKKYVKHRSLCLECGDVIRYGRTDKRFCCEECRTRHNNNLAKTRRLYKAKVLGALDKNYEILDALVRNDEDSADLVELMSLGFAPGVVTSYRKSGKHDVFTCYDIRYIMTRTRVYSIMKIQNL